MRKRLSATELRTIAKVTFSLIIPLFSSLNAQSQTSKSVAIGTLVERPNAILILNPPNHDQGILIPQLTTAERLAITAVSPDDDGLMVFDHTLKGFYYWRENEWTSMAGGTTRQDLTLVGNTIEITNGTSVNLNAVTTAGQISGTLNNLTLGPNTVSTSVIQDGTIQTLDLANLAVSESKIADGAITSLKLANTGVTPNTYGSATEIARITVDAQGRITSASNVSVAGSGSSVDYYSVDPSDFSVLKPEGKADKHGMVVFETDDSFVTAGRDEEGESIVAALNFHHGSTLQEVVIYYWDNASQNLTTTLSRKNLATGINEIINTWSSTGSNASIRTQTLSNFNGRQIISNELFSYRIRIDFNINTSVDNPSQANQRIYGIRIRYQH